MTLSVKNDSKLVMITIQPSLVRRVRDQTLGNSEMLGTNPKTVQHKESKQYKAAIEYNETNQTVESNTLCWVLIRQRWIVTQHAPNREFVRSHPLSACKT